MKIIVLAIVAFATLSGCFSEPATEDHQYEAVNLQGAIEDTINQTLEALKESIPDPLNIENLDITLPGGVLEGFFNASNVQVTGITGYTATELKFSILSMKLDFTIEFGQINLYTKYVSDILVASLIPLYGDGKANIHLEGLKINGSGAANLTGGISLKNVVVEINLGETTFDLHGVLNDESFSAVCSAVLNDVVDTFVNEHKELISGVLSPIIETLINSILKPADPEEFDKLDAAVRDLLKDN